MKRYLKSRKKPNSKWIKYPAVIVLLILTLLIGCGGSKNKPAANPAGSSPSNGGSPPAAYDVLIVKSPASLRFFGWKGNQELKAAGETLHRLGVKYAYLPEDQLKSGQLPCKVLLLPNTRCMSPEAYEGIKKFVKSGGSVIATYMAGYRDQNNRKTGVNNNFALSDTYGVDFASWIQGKPHCEYLVPEKGEKIQLGRNQAMLVKPRKGTEILATWQGEAKSPANGTPAATYNPETNTIFIGEDLFAPENSGSAQVVAYLGNLLEKLSPDCVTKKITGSEGWIPPDFTIPGGIMASVKPGGREVAVGLADPFDGVSLTSSGSGNFSGGKKFFAVTLTRDGESLERKLNQMETAPNARYQVRGVAVVGKNPYIAIYSSSGKLLARSHGPLTFKPAKPDAPVVLFDQKPNGTYKYKAFRGWLRFYPARSGRLLVNNYVTMEEYLAGVVPSEMPASYPAEALKAMAVTARTFANSLVDRGKHKKEGFDVCDQIHCQVYRGLIKERKSSNDAISQTRGVVARYKGKYPMTTFHATNGGYGARASSVWSGDEPYLAGGFDGPGKYNEDLSTEKNLREFIDNPPKTYDSHAGRFRWTQTYSKTELAPKINQALGVLLGRGRPVNIGRLYSIKITSRSRDGRAQEMEILGSEGTYKLKKDQMRWITSGGKISTGGLQSTLFYVRDDGDRISFVGGGWGHGVGLSQEGARGRANAGQKYDEIFKHYYKGVTLETTSPKQ